MELSLVGPCAELTTPFSPRLGTGWITFPMSSNQKPTRTTIHKSRGMIISFPMVVDCRHTSLMKDRVQKGDQCRRLPRSRRTVYQHEALPRFRLSTHALLTRGRWRRLLGWVQERSRELVRLPRESLDRY